MTDDAQKRPGLVPAEKTGPQQRGVPFQAGKSGNPNGRPKGSRNKLGEAFVQDIYTDWLANGVATIAKVRLEKPDQYLKVVASILPKQLDVKVSEVEDLEDDELDQEIVELARQVGADLGFIAQGGTGSAPRGKEKAH